MAQYSLYELEMRIQELIEEGEIDDELLEMLVRERDELEDADIAYVYQGREWQN